MTASNTLTYTPLDPALMTGKDVGAGNKEQEPFRRAEAPPLQEVTEHEAPPEVQPFVQPKKETISLPPDLKMIGLQPVSSTAFPSYQNVKLPISDEKVMTGMHAPVTSSLRWLSTLALYMLKQAHLGLRIVGGRVIRVVKK